MARICDITADSFESRANRHVFRKVLHDRASVLNVQLELLHCWGEGAKAGEGIKRGTRGLKVRKMR